MTVPVSAPPRPAFDSAAREAALDRLGDRPYDVLVIGGGVTGAGIALDAAARGLRVALVERADLASGTSSKSSKLIHGGLRYLENGDVRLVRESVAERNLLRRLAPHLVRPLRFALATTDVRNRALLASGLTAYDALAGPKSIGRHRRLSPAAFDALVPGLDRQARGGGYSYLDCATDDARLTLHVARTAYRLGADVVTRAEVIELCRAGPRVVGAVVADRRSGRHVEVAARWTVSATGVWSDAVRSLTGAAPARLVPSKGVHLTFDATDLPVRAAAVIPSVAGDRRRLFVVPWGGQTYVGTTDRVDGSPLDAPTVTAPDAAYCCDAVNAAFGTTLGPGDAVGAWAGFRPLLAPGAATEEGRDSEALSRRHVVSEEPDGLVTVTGGKLTTYRRMAADVLAHVTTRDGGRRRPSPTRTIPLGLRGSVEDAVVRVGRLASELGLDPDMADGLVTRHGDDAVGVLLRAAETGETAPLVPGLPFLAVEARWAVEQELALTVDDVLTRRLSVAYRDAAAGGDAVDQVADLLGDGADADGYRAAVARERGVVAVRDTLRSSAAAPGGGR